MSIENKTAVITGGSRGIGRAMSEMFAEKGANVIFTYKENKKAAIALAISDLEQAFLDNITKAENGEQG